MAAKKFKADRDTGITVATNDGVHVRIDAGETYTTSDPREIEVLEGASGVVAVKESSGAKKQSKS